VKLVVVLLATQACLVTACVSLGRTEECALRLECVGICSLNVHPIDERLILWQDMVKLCRAGYELRLRYVKFLVVLVATQDCPDMVRISCRRDIRYPTQQQQ